MTFKDICFPSRAHVEVPLITSDISGAIEMGVIALLLLYMSVRVQDCPKDCLTCSLQSGKPWCNPNGCNTTHAYNSEDGTCVGEFCGPSTSSIR